MLNTARATPLSDHYALCGERLANSTSYPSAQSRMHLFFDQIRVSAEHNESIAETARANTLTDFSAYLDRMLNDLFIARMDGNDEIFARVMTDTEFRSAAHQHLAQEIFRRVNARQAHGIQLIG